MSDMMVFICEDEEAWREIVQKYMLPKKVTFAALVDSEKRGAIVEAIDKLV